MKEIKIGKSKVMFYSSIKEMPAKVYNAMQMALMEDTGIGSSIKDVDGHFKQLDILLSSGKIQDAIIERQNMHMAFYAMINGLNTKSRSLSYFVQSIDGVSVTNHEESVKSIMSKLDDMAMGDIIDILNELKKNCSLN